MEPGILPVLGRHSTMNHVSSPHSFSKQSGLCWLRFSLNKSVPQAVRWSNTMREKQDRQMLGRQTDAR